MCGRLNIIDDLFVQALMRDMQIVNPDSLLHGRFKMPTNDISIVREVDGVRQLHTASWWLLQETTKEGFKPSRFTSFNSRFDKLNQPGSASFQPYRESRCIVIAKGFGETETHQGTSRYFDFTAVDSAIAFGGLYKQWRHPKTGERKLSCSIITLPPEPLLTPYHSKASPMILPNHTDCWDAWLSTANTEVAMFNALLEPNLRHRLQGQEINKPSEHQPVSAPFIVGEVPLITTQGQLF